MVRLERIKYVMAAIVAAIFGMSMHDLINVWPIMLSLLYHAVDVQGLGTHVPCSNTTFQSLL